jgi:PEP-CTERM motif
MYRLLILVILALTTLTASAWADVFNVGDSERGFVCTVDAFFCPTGNNNATAGNDYLAGAISRSDNSDVTQARDWFEFAIPSLSGGSLTSATLSLADFGHVGGDLIFALYGLTSQPMQLTDVVTTTPFSDPFDTSSGSNLTTITIQLNSAALAAIAGAQNQNLFIGGIDSGESVGNPATASPGEDFVGDFETSENGTPLQDSTYNAVLNLTTAPAAVPEPSSIALLLSAAFGAGLMRRRRKIRAH